MKSSSQVRSSFLDYFRKHGHEAVRSSPLVPADDPTLLFTNAGMVQFKDVFTGRESRPYSRATSSQKCVRAGGKHNDLENVGRTARHQTFFEMLGNFSFGDYFKEQAIAYAWEWLTRELALDRDRLVITVFGGDAALGLGPDDEARAIWKKVTGFSDERIRGLGMKDNFWMMGDTGPQGPCSEIYYYFGDAKHADPGKLTDEPGPDGVGWTEIWNLVFMQFERKAKDAPLTPLPRPSIDTGAGLERVTAVVQGVTSNYDTDLLRPIVELAGAMAKKKYGASMSDDDVSMRVLADHARASAFLIADGVSPSNEGRGYVLRRIMRRAIRHGVRLGLEQERFAQLCVQVIEMMSEPYPELRTAAPLISRTASTEDENFRRTMDRGLKLLDEVCGKLPQGATLPGETVFKLYDTYGFPADLTRVIAEERGFGVDEAGFEREMDKQRARSEDFAGSGEKAVADVYKELRAKHGETEFLGYNHTQAEGHIQAVLKQGDKLEIIADRTPFYGESGGQVGDTGTIKGEDFTFNVEDTLKPGGDLIVHRGKIAYGEPKVGGLATFTVDVERRDQIRANHSATHLLHLALKEVLGDHVAQKGSLVAPERLRFDFSHFQPMTEDEKRRVEELINAEIRHNTDSRIEVKSFDEARRSGAVALFGEKYGDQVRVMRIGRRSTELCGGTHVRRTGDIGLFKITQELGIAQGVRRLEAVTGKGAVEYVQQVETQLKRVAELFHASAFNAVEAVERQQKELKERDKRIEELQRKLASGGSRDAAAEVREVAGIKVLVRRTDVADAKALREVADHERDKLKSGVVVLGGAGDGKVSLVAAVTADLTGRVNAGKIVAELAKMVGGKGGGRADLAQGGGSDVAKLDEALAAVYKLIS